MAAEFNTELKLDQFQNGDFKRMNEFRKQNLDCDVNLAVDGKLFPCHRSVLISASPYFETMFNGNFQESNSNVITLKEIDAGAIELILNTLYTARIRLFPENVYFVLRASHLLQLEAIVDACAKCIIKNTRIHCLVDTCLFAKSIAQQNLYDACIQGIFDDLIHWMKTDSFEELSVEDLNLLLSKRKEEYFMRNKYRAIHADDLVCERLKELLESKSRKSKRRVIEATESEPVEAFDENSEHNEVRMNPDFCFNLYMNTFEVITGAKGWSVLNMNDTFDKYSSLSTFHPTNNIVEAFCKVGTKTYCLEWDNIEEKYCVFCYDDNNRTELKIPEQCVRGSNIRNGIVAIENNIYLISNYDICIWIYNCELDKWSKAYVENFEYYKTEEYMYSSFPGSPKRKELYDNCGWRALTTLDNVLYVIGSDINYCGDLKENYIVSFDNRSAAIRKPISSIFSLCALKQIAACSLDGIGKIALSGSSFSSDYDERAFNIYDVRACGFLEDREPMIGLLENNKLIHRENFIYAVENDFYEKNEKYDMISNTWTEIPYFLPKRVMLKNADGVATFTTGYVFGADTNSAV